MRTTVMYQPKIYKDAGLEILSFEGDATRTVVYHVTQLCCGKAGTLKHQTVKRRIDGTGRAMCRNCVAAAQLEEMKARGVRRPPTTLPDSEVEALKEMIHGGYPYYVIAKTLNRSESTIQRYADRLGLKRTAKERQLLRQANLGRTQAMIDRQKMADEERARLGRRRPRPIILWLKAMTGTNR